MLRLMEALGDFNALVLPCFIEWELRRKLDCALAIQ